MTTAGVPLRIGTRGSALARAQASLVAAALTARGFRSELVILETDGDRRTPDTAWGEGAFVTTIEAALRDGRIDLAVHSAKDVPVRVDPDLEIAAFLPRAAAADALVLGMGSAARDLGGLPHGARVGTDSPRRTGFLRAVRPDLHVHPLHGNVDTRLRRLDAGETDALVLAVAGLARLGLERRISQVLDPLEMPPAPGQGAIALQCRVADPRTRRVLATVDDAPTRIAVETERALLAAAGGGCRAPIGAWATFNDSELAIVAGYARPDGSAAAVERRTGRPDQRDAMIADLVDTLSVRVPGVRRTPGDPARVIITRPIAQADGLVEALAAAGVVPLLVPAIEIEPALPGAPLDAAIAGLPDGGWVVVTSANGAAAALAAARRAGRRPGDLRWAAVGETTAAALAAGDVTATWQPPRASGRAIGEALPATPTDVVLLARADLASRDLPDALAARGIHALEATAYTTRQAPPSSLPALREALAGPPPDAVVALSGSAVRGLLELAAAIGPNALDAVRAIPVVCIGPETAAIARACDLVVLGQAAMQRADRLAALVLDLTATPSILQHPEPA
jgi:hydroxymethylbilane synthase